VKHPNPYLAISIAVFRLFVIGQSSSAEYHHFCAAASQSVLAPGFRGDATSRVDSVTGS
jgi:hypothetical protein